MGKYDFELELNTANALKLVDDLIMPGTDVLEFGCANGRLTKHLAENKRCNVSIVEIDQEAGLEASKYAVKSLIGMESGDIEKYIWTEALESKFDYIIFADILEHLYHPEMALERCRDFLKPGGSIIVSLPNIAHNSIIIELINNRFNYQEIGLLDDTHIRFFTNDSFKKMLDRINLKVIKEFATYSKVGNNEIVNNYDEVDDCVAEKLRKRPFANVHQYIYEIRNGRRTIDLLIENHISEYQNCDYEASIFITENVNEKIEEAEPIKKIYMPLKDKDIIIKISFNHSRYINKLRIDPIESSCVIEINSIKIFFKGEEKNIPIGITNRDYQIGNVYFFVTSDPQLYFEEINRYADRIEMRFKIIECKLTKYQILKGELENRRIIIEQKENYIGEQRDIIGEQRNIIEQKENYICEQRRIIEEKQNELNQIKASRFYKFYKSAKSFLNH